MRKLAVLLGIATICIFISLIAMQTLDVGNANIWLQFHYVPEMIGIFVFGIIFSLPAKRFKFVVVIFCLFMSLLVFSIYIDTHASVVPITWLFADFVLGFVVGWYRL